MGETFNMHGRDEKCIKNVVKPTGKRPLGRSRHRWEDNINMVVEELQPILSSQHATNNNIANWIFENP
jgi:hypothetical protein